MTRYADEDSLDEDPESFEQDDDVDDATDECPYCGAEISSLVDYCPKCRQYISQEDSLLPTRSRRMMVIVVLLILAFTGLLALF